MSLLRVALCQVNPTVGDLDGNVELVVEAIASATDAGADVAVLPELVTTGYPPEDLLLKPRFVAENLDALARIARTTTTCAAVVGFVDRGMDLYNAAAVCHNGSVVGRYHKRVLPNYGVFDEQRYFAPGSGDATLFEIGGVRVGVSICEDAWSPDGPIAEQAAAGAEVMLSLNASPYFAGKVAVREAMLATRANDASVPIVYVNQVGGQDELVFDGASMVFDRDGKVLARATQFLEETMFVDIEVRHGYRKRLLDPRGRTSADPLLPVHVSGPRHSLDTDRLVRLDTPALDALAEVYAALVLGVGDYVDKNGFTDVVLGISGGIDSALVAAIAVDAIGADQVHGLAMPSRYSSEGSLTDARALSSNLGIDLKIVGIDRLHREFEGALGDLFGAGASGLTDENLQSRLRGVVLMAASNEHGWLVLTTGNKSELAVGYSTLYGDTAGGFAVIKDVPKTLVYQLCEWRNSREVVIPTSIIEKPPSAELRPDQRDDQSLVPYEILDPILAAYVEDDLTAAEIEHLGYDLEVVRKIVQLVDRAEYKRRQSPIGVRVTPKAFGKDRRVPITNRFRA